MVIKTDNDPGLLIGQFCIIDSTGNSGYSDFRNLRPTSQGTPKLTYAVALPAAVSQVCGQYMPSLNVCFIRSPTRNFRNFWSNEKRPFTFLYGYGVPLLIPMFLFMIIFENIDDKISRLPPVQIVYHLVLYNLRCPP